MIVLIANFVVTNVSSGVVYDPSIPLLFLFQFCFRNTGEISINRRLKAFEFYKMTVAVRNKITNQTDEARISVALEPPTRRINRYSPEIFNGYEDDEEDEFSYSHHISKRVSHQNKKN